MSDTNGTYKDDVKPWRPVPDPTSLTTEQLLREIAATKEIFFAKLDDLHRLITYKIIEINNSHAASLNHIAETRNNLSDRIIERLRCNDERFAEQKINNEKAHNDIRDRIALSILGEKDMLDAVKSCHNENNKVVERRFTLIENDIERRSNDIKEALFAAVVASRDAMTEQYKANKTAIDKSEIAIGEQIKQLNNNVYTLNNATTDKIDDVKERMNALERVAKVVEGRSRGMGDMWGMIIGTIGVIATVITVIFLALKDGLLK